MTCQGLPETVLRVWCSVPPKIPESCWPDCRLCGRRIDGVEMRQDQLHDEFEVIVRCHGVMRVTRIPAKTLIMASNDPRSAEMFIGVLHELAQFSGESVEVNLSPKSSTPPERRKLGRRGAPWDF